ncbi:hypothetical protein [Mesobacillus maritimus]|uniref:Uncharacterized protein n=1 Tax=Mesobacillus maritimus TaxID=1643336 RepID=A0ABS7KBI2_9BACI|nr:hypothetical protein [Mesobacillus maritimus]MBY0099636.1 hypothetical protein [Mesobacillus maritimus]
MDKIVILSIVVLVIIVIIIGLYLISRYKQQAIQVITLESFMNAHHLNEENKKQSIMDMINGFFDDNDEGNDGFDEGDSDDGGE